METMWKFRAGRFTVKGMIEPDYDLDLSWDESGETSANLESGLWVAFQTKVAVYFDGEEIGTDYLGGSIYEHPADFFKERDGYFVDMVRTAIAEARKHMRAVQSVYVREG